MSKRIMDKKTIEEKNGTSETEFDENLVIIAQHLTKDYEIGEFVIRAVDNVSLDVVKNDFIVINGPSGAGKTTLLNLLGGLDSPNSGSITFSGVKITDMEEESLATFRLLNSGFIFQNYNLISTLTAEENVMFPMSLTGLNLKSQREKAVSLLKKTGLGSRREHLPFQLSAGEQQRVTIARALANDPPLILADEPTANLDKNTSIFIRDLFKDMKDGEITVIIASHDDYIFELANRVISFEDGKIIKEN
jgi:putative ABC transport system ATP-binding protein